MKVSNKRLRVYLASVAAVGLLGFSGASHAFSIAGWTCTGTCGTLGADGVVTASPFGGNYGYVTTNDGISGVGALPGVGGDPTNGTVITSPLFSADVGSELSFFFNYVTSDGAGFADYAWARVLDSVGDEALILFTARTIEDGDTVPGFGLPGLGAGVTLLPASTPIIPGGPAWSPLGIWSGECFAAGCGYTGWIQALYTFTAAGNFRLQFGVTNWLDQGWDSGMAFDGTTIDGDPIGVPEPAPLALLGLSLIALRLLRSRGVARG